MILSPPPAALVVDFLTAGFLVTAVAAVFFCWGCRDLLTAVGAVEVTVVMQDIAGEVYTVVEKQVSPGEGYVAPAFMQAGDDSVFMSTPGLVSLSLLLTGLGSGGRVRESPGLVPSTVGPPLGPPTRSGDGSRAAVWGLACLRRR